MANYRKSQIDELFYRLMGHYPAKEGEAYEIISTAVLGLVENKDAAHNQFLIGKSETKYQLDGLIDSNIMLEAKDYTKSQDKVGRDDLQKLQGALTDLPQIEKGYFTSATKYTEPAQKYAKGSATNICQKEIIPIELRPSTTDDEKGRIAKINISLIMVYPNFHEGKYEILFSGDERHKFENYLKESGLNKITLDIQELYDSTGKIVETIEHLSKTQFPKFPTEAKEVSGIFHVAAFIKIEERLFAINGIKYHVPIRHAKESFAIESNGNATVLVKSEKLGINKLITDTDMKKAINKELKES